MTSAYFAYTGDKKDAPPADAKAAYEKSFAAVAEALDRSEFLFPVEFREDAERYVQIHKAINKLGVQTTAEYRGFMGGPSREFDGLCSAVFTGSPSEPLPRLTIAKIDFDQRDALGPKEYLDQHFAYWKQHQGKGQ